MKDRKPEKRLPSTPKESDLGKELSRMFAGSHDFAAYFKPEIRAVLSDKQNWSEDLPNQCAACDREFDMDEIPLYMWSLSGRWCISFHIRCVLGHVEKK